MVTKIEIICLIAISCSIFTLTKAKKDERECEVCIGTLEKFKKEAPQDAFGSLEKLTAAFRRFCEKVPKGGKENKFCYYIGGTKDAATGILKKVVGPLNDYIPTSKICHNKLKQMDHQICELRYDVKPDFSKLNKMRVGELKKILSNWGEDGACKGCAEKSDFIKKVKELLPKYEQEEYKKLQAAERGEL